MTLEYITYLLDQRVDQRVVYVNESADRRVDLGQLLDGQYSRHKVAARALVVDRHLEAHQPVLEELPQHDLVDLALLLHLADERLDVVAGQLGHRLLHHLLVLGEEGQGHVQAGLLQLRRELDRAAGVELADLEGELARQRPGEGSDGVHIGVRVFSLSVGSGALGLFR